MNSWQAAHKCATSQCIHSMSFEFLAVEEAYNKARGKTIATHEIAQQE